MRAFHLALGVALATLGLACSQVTDFDRFEGGDGGMDAATDAGMDAAADAQMDAAADAQMDAAADAQMDAAADAQMDAAADAQMDAAADAQMDAAADAGSDACIPEVCNREDDDCDDFADEELYQPGEDLPLAEAVEPTDLRGDYSAPLNQFGAVWHDEEGNVVTFGLIDDGGNILQAGETLQNAARSSDVCWDGHHWTVVFSHETGTGTSEAFWARFSSVDGQLLGEPQPIEEAPTESTRAERTRPKQIRCGHAIVDGQHLVGVIWNGVEQDETLGSILGYYATRQLLVSTEDSIEPESPEDLDFHSDQQLVDPAIVGADDLFITAWSAIVPRSEPGETTPAEIRGAQVEADGTVQRLGPSEANPAHERDLELGFDPRSRVVALGYRKDDGESTVPHTLRFRLGDGFPPQGEPFEQQPLMSTEPAYAGDLAFGHLVGAQPQIIRLRSEDGMLVDETLVDRTFEFSLAFPMGVPVGPFRYGILWTDGNLVNIHLVGCSG